MPKKIQQHMMHVPLSPYSVVFYHEWKLNSQRSDYNIVFDQTVSGELDRKQLSFALNQMIQDYFLLHSKVEEEDEKYCWHPVSNLTLELDYFSTPPSETVLLHYVQKPFDLRSPPFLRCALIEVKKNHFRLIMVLHHILIDGGKCDFFIDRLSQYYNQDHAQLMGPTLEEQIQKLSNLSASFEAKLLKNKANHEAFWNEELNFISRVDLRFLKPTDPLLHQKEGKILNEIINYHFDFDETVIKQIRLIGRKYKITPYLFSQAIFALLIYRYNGQKDIALSYPVSIPEGRNFALGAHINTNIIHYHFSREMQIGTLLEQVQAHFKKVKGGQHAFFPIQEIAALIEDRHVLDIAFAQTNLRRQKLSFKNIETLEIHDDLYVDLPMTLSFEQEEINGCIQYRVRYKNTSIDHHLIVHFIAAYQRLFMNILDDLSNNQDSALLSSYNILSQNQYQLTLYEWNKTEKNLPSHKNIMQLFEEQVKKTPEQAALIYEDQTLSYLELNKRANQMAHYLRRTFSLQADDLVSLCLERNEWMIISMLAVLKSGAAYVPIDAQSPPQRTDFIFQDTASKIMIDSIFLRKNKELFERESTENPKPISKGSNLAYVIYTSGTTGNPKGVMIEQRSAVNTIWALHPIYKGIDNKRVTAYTNYVFDVFFSEVFTTLTCGLELHLLGRERFDINALSLYLNAKAIHLAYLPPAILSILPRIAYPHLKTIIFAGEPCPQEVGLYWLKHIHLYNYYGPTEATVYATGKRVMARNINEIGHPLMNTQAYVLDPELNPLPIGAIGELYLGGIGLARGYLNRPELMKERFIPNHFQTRSEKKSKKNTHLYKTGDLVRYLPDGNLEYFGRNDFQVKIRGYRIELGEIESALSRYPGITQSVVLVRTKDASPYLIAYYIAKAPLKEEVLLHHLSKNLPDYMLPNRILYLENLPLTLNGKLNRKELPFPEFINIDQYIAPKNKQEALICEEFEKVLGLKTVGTQDDFFKIGGNSIKGISVVSRLQAYFKIQISDLFQYKTPSELAQNIPFEGNVLRERLEHIKNIYSNAPPLELTKTLALSRNISQQVPLFNLEKKIIQSVLLTGASGFLGCNLLHQLLKKTPYTVFLPIRAESDEAALKRLDERYFFYFAERLADVEASRLFIFAADLEKTHLGLSDSAYQNLTHNIDSILHAAALTKHYGAYETFYSANVQATLNLLNVCKETKRKEFHHISTSSILGAQPYIQATEAKNKQNHSPLFLNEEDTPYSLLKNVYIQTKYEAEQAVIASRETGINSHIYRVGNLAIMSNGQRQQNIQDNAFFKRVEGFLNLGSIPEAMAQAEISPVDTTADAILSLFDQVNLKNQIFHVFNPYTFHLGHFLTQNSSVKVLAMNQFIDKISLYLNQAKGQKEVERFLLHQGWLEENPTLPGWITVLQERTQACLKKLGFEWHPIENSIFLNAISQDILKDSRLQAS